MPAHTIIGWLRRRRAVAHAAWRYRGALRSYGTSGRSGVWPYAGSAVARLDRRRPVLRAPIDWRERMLARVDDAAVPSESPELESLIPSAAFVRPDDVTLVGGQWARGRAVSPRVEDGAGDAASPSDLEERQRASSVPASASETATARSTREPSDALPAARPPSTMPQLMDERRSEPAGSSVAAAPARADASTPDAPVVERAHASGSDAVAPAARRGAEHAPPAARTEDGSSREAAVPPSRATREAPVNAPPSWREPSGDVTAPVAAPPTASTEPTGSGHSRRAASDGKAVDPSEQAAPSGRPRDEAPPPSREPRVAPPTVTDAGHRATPATGAHPGDEAPAAASRDVIASRPVAPERTPREAAATPRVAASDAQSTARVVRDDHEAPPQNAEGSSAPRDDGATEGLRPIEERRARRPAARRAELPPRDSERVEAAGSDVPGTPAVDPGDAREGTTSERATSEEPTTSDSTTSERATSDWRRLLFEATSAPARPGVTQPVSPPARGAAAPSTRAPDRAPLVAREAPPAAPPPATPLLESTRRFLRPRVGIDPASVTIVRGPDTDRLLAESVADAVAVGEVVAVSSTLDERSPRALGVLAHELAHVAQRRHPRFVPPVLRASESNASLQSPSRPVPNSEETLARRVEHAVRADAERLAHRGEGATHARDTEPIVAVPEEYAIPERHAQLWGTLPAPWEPLPYAPVATGDISAPATLTLPTVQAAPVHYAEQGRTMESEQQDGAAPAAPSPAPAPDLDVLARRVYDVLKRRLAAERRREG